jgi:2-amino-4-hydroxy-6-hydroxymethyldihydropteridine diphosphokinase
MSDSEVVIIALGSNQGDPRHNVLRALNLLQEFSEHPIRASSLWETTPLDCPPNSPPFINAIAVLVPRSGETPESLLENLQRLERDFGRQPKRVQNEPRPLDLDLIAFGNQTRRSLRLTVPHPRACARRFVLAPLCELLPNLVFPGETKSVSQLLEDLPADLGMRRAG